MENKSKPGFNVGPAPQKQNVQQPKQAFQSPVQNKSVSNDEIVRQPVSFVKNEDPSQFMTRIG